MTDQARTLTDPGCEEITWYGWCPVQAHGWVDGCAVYFRARGSAWRLEIGDGPRVAEWGTPAKPAWCVAADYGEFPDAGWMSDDHVRWCLRVAIAVWRARGGRSAPRGYLHDHDRAVVLAAPFVPQPMPRMLGAGR